MGHCYNSTVVHADIATVWDIIKDFHKTDWASGVLDSNEKVGDIDGLTVGAKRILNGAIHETLIESDNDGFSFTYTLDNGPEPISPQTIKNYTGTVTLYPVTDSDHTFVEWTTSYGASNEDEVAEFCNPIYAALLTALKNHVA